MESLQPTGLSPEKLNEMDDNRIQLMLDAGIDEQDVLGKARDNMNLWNSYFNENNVRGKDDMNFVLRDQWTAIERSEFNRLFKPALTFNKLYDPIKKIAGEQRKNKPDLMVRSLTGKASEAQIDLRSDLIRTICYRSQNDLIYQSAFKSALLRGYGAWQISIDYEDPRSFYQDIRFNLIPDVTRTAFDPSAVKPHKGDGNFCARNYLFSKEEFFATYPFITNPVSYSDPRTLLDFQWETKDTIVVCDYYAKEWYPLIIVKLSNGEVLTEDEWEEKQKHLEKVKNLMAEPNIVDGIIQNEMPKVVAKRQTQDYNVMHYRLIKNQIIDFTKWPSRQLPIIFVDGDSYFIDGMQYTRSFIHEAKDAQKLLNYVKSETAADIKNRRREQWIGTPDNIIGQEQQWKNPELQQGMLKARPDPKTGQMPTKMPASDIPQGLFMGAQALTIDMREILGFSETGTPSSQDISGIAKRERQREGNDSAFVWLDNLNQSLEQSGRVVLDLLPSVYWEENRNIILSKADGKTQPFVLNKLMPDGSYENELSAGNYDIEIAAGPSFAVQKELAVEFLIDLCQVSPQVFPLVADYVAKNLDLAFMPQISERFKTLVPPDILAKEEGREPPPPQPDPQAQLMQAEMQLKQADIQSKQEALKIKEQELQLKKEQNELDHAKLMLDAQKVQTESQLDIFNHHADIERSRITHGLDHKKADLDFKAKIAKIVADIHSEERQREHEKHLNATKLTVDILHPKHQKKDESPNKS